MKPIAALAEFYGCYYTHKRAVVEVWEDVDRLESDRPPKYIGCHECGEMRRLDWEDV